jgi:hypothetical protein
MSELARESGRFYHPSGEPFYEIASAKGEMRPTTLRDAKKVAALPSVTTIMKCAARPGLDIWLRKQLALALLTLPRIAGESADDFLKRAEADAEKEAESARSRGTEIHGAIERHLLLQSYDPAYTPHIEVAMRQLETHCGDGQVWASEKSFAHPMGYGGKVDLHTPPHIRNRWVIDFKGVEWKEKPPTLYDEHYQQLAAYRRGLNLPDARCAIVFIGRESPVRAVLLEAEEDGLRRGLKCFDALLDFWWARNETPTYHRAA